jgi:ATP-dependent RNA helicase DHX29
MKSKPVTLPAELDCNSSNPSIINAALVAGLYPKVLALDTSKSELKTITNNQTVSVHPSSVNFHKKLSDIGCNYLAYFTLMFATPLVFIGCFF